MTFASPIWLALLLPPWIALIAWLMWMRHSGTRVPFLVLWRGSVEPTRATRRLRLPPAALLALFAAMLLAILAAAQPKWRGPPSPPPRIATTGPSTPPSRPSNVAITRVAAIDRPRAQLMVTVRNDSELAAARLEVRSGETAVGQDLSLPPRSQQRSYFIDLPTLAEKLEVTLADHHATLTRESLPAKVEVRGDVPPEVRRVAEAYSHARPAGEEGSIVAIPSAGSEPGVIVAAGEFSTGELRAPQVTDHPVTDHVDFAALSTAWVSATDPGGDGWTVLVSSEGRPLVAVRESPARQVWIGFHSPDFARTPAFVVLWTNVLDWVGGTGETHYVATLSPPESIAPAKPQAAAAGAPEFDVDVAPAVALAALFCLFFAALRWPRG